MSHAQASSTVMGSAEPQGTGRLTTDFGKWNFDYKTTYDDGYSVALQPNGKILAAGQSNDHFALARYNADGSLDKGFSDDGRLTTGFGGYHESCYSVALQPGGKVLVAGGSDGDFALARYNADGSLDQSFSGDGKLKTDFGSYDIAYSLASQPDGKILAAGEGGNGFALARYNADGGLDQSFSGDGMLVTDFGGGHSYGVALQPDGKVLVAGESWKVGSGYIGYNFALARYNADGSLDQSFSGDGKLTTDFGSGDYGYSIALQPDGKVLVAGASAGGFALARYNADGSLDKSFSGDGLLTTYLGGPGSGRSVALQPDGKILVAGESWKDLGAGSDFALARYNADGSLDKSFSGDGLLTTNFGDQDHAYSLDYGYSVAVQPDGKIVVAGKSEDDFALARYNADGSLDTTFGERSPIGNSTVQFPAGKEDVAYTIKASDLLQGFTDPDGDPVIVDVLDADHGKLTPHFTGIWTNAPGSYTFTPDRNYNGTVSFSYNVSDADSRGGGFLVQQSFTLAAVNDAPAIKPATFSVDENSAKGAAVGQVHGADVDGDALSYRLASGNTDQDGDGQPAFALDAKTGGLSVNDPGDLDFETHPSFVLKATATDPEGLSGSAILTVRLSNLNEVQGTAGPDTLRGTSGKDWLDGGAGDDWLVGGQGDDALLGGDGNDRADFSKSLAPIRADLATGTATGQGADTLVGIENLTGGFAGDSLSGDANPNILWGGPGDDGMEGNAGDDRLGGGLGNDTIKGGNGNDTLYGSKGLDTLAGGAGADRFLYKAAIDTGNTAAARDAIADFSRAEGDKVDVSAWDAKPSVAGVQHWSFVASFTGQAGQIRFDSSAQLVLFDQDGDQQADFQIELTGVATLSAADFVLV